MTGAHCDGLVQGRSTASTVVRACYGGSPDAEREDFEVDALDIAELLGHAVQLTGDVFNARLSAFILAAEAALPSRAGPNDSPRPRPAI